MLAWFLPACRTLKEAFGFRWQLLGLFVALAIWRLEDIAGFLADKHIIPQEAGGMILGAPTWLWAITFAFVYMFFWVFAYAHKLRLKIKASRVELSVLRKRGVALRNFGRTKIRDEECLDRWISRTNEWHKKVYEAVKHISVADAEWFDVMDVVPPPRLALCTPFDGETQANLVSKHVRRYSQHDFQVMRLGEMIRDLWGK